MYIKSINVFTCNKRRMVFVKRCDFLFHNKNNNCIFININEITSHTFEDLKLILTLKKPSLYLFKYHANVSKLQNYVSLFLF